MKTYIFEHTQHGNIKIEISHYSFEQAYRVLVAITKHPADYKCTNPPKS